MNEDLRETIRFLINNHKRRIKSDISKLALKQEPNFLEIQKEEAKIKISQIINRLKEQYSDILPFKGEIKKCIKDITEETHINAVYFLLCYAFQNWDSLLLLANYRKSSTMQIVNRSIKESLALIELFVLEYNENTRTELNKWYSGEIIDNRICRDKLGKFYDQNQQIVNQDFKKLNVFIYRSDSHPIHNAYVSILESISPFTEDFDEDGPTGFIRTLSTLKYIEETMVSTVLAIKFIYIFLFQDSINLQRIEVILRKYWPNMKLSRNM